MSATLKNPPKAKPTDREVLEAREAELLKKYKRIEPGSIRRETKGSHAGKLTVVIHCAREGCTNTRRVATSDLWQVKYCVDCTRELRNKKRRKAKKEKVKSRAKATHPVAAKEPELATV